MVKTFDWFCSYSGCLNFVGFLFFASRDYYGRYSCETRITRSSTQKIDKINLPIASSFYKSSINDEVKIPSE